MSSGRITHLAEVGSTNDWLLARAGELSDGQWVLADRQTAGRGRRGRAWGDGAGNLMASVLVKAEGPVQQLSFVAALALHTALAQGDRIRLKWPNDLLLDGTKVSGILLERSATALVIGFGANLRSFPTGTERPAISLAAAGLPVPATTDLLAALITAFSGYRGLWATQGFEPIRSRWLALAAGVGDRIAARLGTETLEGRFEGLEPDGALALRLDDGSLRPVHAGEVFSL
ncbi:biotin--[acetyl-CoA-carboxylase] ligase [Sandarakinorhabdus sp. DWP1-3-1]|uniref:biotin--[acetyl-CoA-carboxylase] ligase n=1 Tax=Sandarakinorhabdus sp. DWP1-3-1 TaxID=2804627 RepID=UPI003CECAA26